MVPVGMGAERGEKLGNSIGIGFTGCPPTSQMVHPNHNTLVRCAIPATVQVAHTTCREAGAAIAHLSSEVEQC